MRTTRARGIHRLIALCEQLHERRRPMSVRELIEATDMPRSSAYDLINTLMAAGWLQQDGSGKVFFGSTMHYYGLDYADYNDVLKRARPIMRRLAAQYNETVQLCTLDGNKYTVLLNEHGARPFGIRSEIGVKVPIPWTASGRVLLANMEAEEILALIPDDDFTLMSGGRLDPAAFLQEIRQAALAGYAITNGLVDAFACCMAVPVFDTRSGRINGRPSHTLCFTTNHEAPADYRNTLLEALLAAAKSLSH